MCAVIRGEEGELRVSMPRQNQGGMKAVRMPKSSGETQVPSDGLQQVVAAIESFDYATANAQLGKVVALLPVQELVGGVVVPLLRLVGDRLHNGTLTAVQEHMTTAIVRNRLGGLLCLHARSSLPSQILFATLSGELHEFGILASAVLAVGGGFEALYMGPNLPPSEILAVAGWTSPEAVVLGIKTSKPSPETIKDLRLVASRLPKRTELWLGGDEVKKTLLAVRGVGGIVGARVFALETFEELDVHLARLKHAIGNRHPQRSNRLPP